MIISTLMNIDLDSIHVMGLKLHRHIQNIHFVYVNREFYEK